MIQSIIHIGSSIQDVFGCLLACVWIMPLSPDPPRCPLIGPCRPRVRRLGYYDHTQRQLGERALYVFPAKVDTTRITCDGPEGAPLLPEDPVARRVGVCVCVRVQLDGGCCYSLRVCVNSVTMSHLRVNIMSVA